MCPLEVRSHDTTNNEKVCRLKNNSVLQSVSGTSFCWPKCWDLFKIHSQDKARQTVDRNKNYLYLSERHSDRVTQSLHCADMALLSAQVRGTARSGSLRDRQVIRMHAPAKAKHAVTHLEWEQMGPKPGLWSWHLIPTSCRLSEQLQGRTLQLSCNDQFDKGQHTQQSQILKRYRGGTFLGTRI